MKTVVVTGVSRGLGLAIAQALLREGYRVHGLSRTKSPEVEKLAMDHGDAFGFRRLDISDLDAAAEVGRDMAKTIRPIYGLVNNAGASEAGVLASMHRSDIERQFQTNIVGPILFTKYIMRPMLAAREGRIVNISSVAAKTGFNGLAVYGATKAAMEGFTRSLSREAGRMNVTVNCVAPGYLHTAMTADLTGAKLASVERRAPLGLPSVDQVAAAVSFLLSPAAGAMTGTTITVDGGSSA